MNAYAVTVVIHDLAVGGITSYLIQLTITRIYALLRTVSEHLKILANKQVVP